MCTMAEIHQKPSKHSMRTVYCHNRVSINGVTSAKFVYKCYARSKSGLPIQVHWWWQCWTSSYHDPSKQMGGYWWSGTLVIALPIKSSITELTFVNVNSVQDGPKTSRGHRLTMDQEVKKAVDVWLVSHQNGIKKSCNAGPSMLKNKEIVLKNDLVRSQQLL